MKDMCEFADAREITDRRSGRRRYDSGYRLSGDRHEDPHPFETEFCQYPTEFDKAPMEHAKKSKDGKDDGFLKWVYLFASEFSLLREIREESNGKTQSF